MNPLRQLKREALSAARWTSLAALLRVAIQFLQVVILARLLSPSDFGTMAVVVAVLAFVQMFADLGVSNAIIHYRDITQAQLASLYWLNVAASAVLALALALASPWVAALYGEALLQPLLATAALSIFLGGLWQQLQVQAQKELQFASLAGIEVACALASLLVSVVLAWRGAGIYALLGGVIASAAVGAAMGWLLLSRGWKPQLILRTREIRNFLSFGMYMIGNHAVGALNSSVDVLLGGTALSADALGRYSVSKNLCMQVIGAVNPIITRVGFPVMAKYQDDDGVMKTVYLRTISLTASLNFPIFVAISFFAPEIVRLAFGPQWDAAAPVLQVLAWWALLRSIGNPVGSLLMARGRADLEFRWNVAWLVVFVPVVWISSRFGAEEVAIALAGVGVVAQWPNWYFLVKPLCGARFGEYFREIAVPLALSLVAGLGAHLAALPFTGDFARLATGVACGGVLYLVLSLVWNRAWPLAVVDLLKMRRLLPGADAEQE